jgi:hypothetical protein
MKIGGEKVPTFKIIGQVLMDKIFGSVNHFSATKRRIVQKSKVAISI